jgi:outer membrane protein assembly factor BamB
MKRQSLIAAVLILAGGLTTRAQVPAPVGGAADVDQWAQWRGPLASGVAPKGQPPVQWSEQQNVKWKVPIPGHGASTPIVWGDRVFLQAAMLTDRQDAVPQVTDPKAPPPTTIPAGMAAMFAPASQNVHEFVLMCLDRGTGKVLWQKVVKQAVPHERHHRDHGYASYSPITDGKHVVAYFGSRGVHCFDMEGKLLWQKDLGLMRTRNAFGEGGSPALHEGVLIINWDHEGTDFIVAMDVASGRELWRTPRDEPTSWSTPLVVRHGQQTQVIVSATTRIRGYDLANGKALWECGGMTANVIPSPVSADGMVYAVSGHRGNAAVAIRLGKEGDLTDSDAIVWSYRKHMPYVPSPLLYGQRLYACESNKAVLTCLDTRTGKPLYAAQKLEALEGVYSSPVGAAGRVYLVGRNGATVVLKDADALQILATNTLDDHFTASPAIVGKELLLRGHKHLYCLEQR